VAYDIVLDNIFTGEVLHEEYGGLTVLSAERRMDDLWKILCADLPGRGFRARLILHEDRSIVIQEISDED